ncbi:hypothetical protein EBR56_04240 [bacterium]|nr:hypothetical protein [bacterium]
MRDFFGADEGPLEGDTPAWAVSLAIHVVVLLGLALASLGKPLKPDRNVTVIEVPLTAEQDVELVPQEMAVAEEPEDTQGAESEQSDAVAEALAPTLAEISVVPVEAEPDAAVDVQLDLVHELPSAQQIDAAVRALAPSLLQRAMHEGRSNAPPRSPPRSLSGPPWCAGCLTVR